MRSETQQAVAQAASDIEQRQAERNRREIAVAASEIIHDEIRQANEQAAKNAVRNKILFDGFSSASGLRTDIAIFLADHGRMPDSLNEIGWEGGVTSVTLSSIRMRVGGILVLHFNPEKLRRHHHPHTENQYGSQDDYRLGLHQPRYRLHCRSPARMPVSTLNAQYLFSSSLHIKLYCSPNRDLTYWRGCSVRVANRRFALPVFPVFRQPSCKPPPAGFSDGLKQTIRVSAKPNRSFDKQTQRNPNERKNRSMAR